jgi:hypothetical protein
VEEPIGLHVWFQFIDVKYSFIDLNVDGKDA